mmetsp:Transcript_40939/g.102298  ORF Transcript_40939/g.102298 Transcript_40939/m.102298 type:complete len:92 (-) Transcript_40939:387-662(-)
MSSLDRRLRSTMGERDSRWRDITERDRDDDRSRESNIRLSLPSPGRLGGLLSCDRGEGKPRPLSLRAALRGGDGDLERLLGREWRIGPWGE